MASEQLNWSYQRRRSDRENFWMWLAHFKLVAQLQRLHWTLIVWNCRKKENKILNSQIIEKFIPAQFFREGLKKECFMLRFTVKTNRDVVVSCVFLFDLFFYIFLFCFKMNFKRRKNCILMFLKRRFLFLNNFFSPLHSSWWTVFAFALESSDRNCEPKTKITMKKLMQISIKAIQGSRKRVDCDALSMTVRKKCHESFRSSCLESAPFLLFAVCTFSHRSLSFWTKEKVCNSYANFTSPLLDNAHMHLTAICVE